MPASQPNLIMTLAKLDDRPKQVKLSSEYEFENLNGICHKFRPVGILSKKDCHVARSSTEELAPRNDKCEIRICITFTETYMSVVKQKDF